MSTTNGVLQPSPVDPSLSRSPPGKRKRESSAGEVSLAERDGVSDATGSSKKAQLDQTIRDLFHVLKRYDSDLLLQHPLPLQPSTEPETKRTKLSENAPETSSIESRIGSDEYNSIQELVNDIEAASKLVIDQHQQNDAGTNGFTPRSQAKPGTDIINRVAAFKKHLDNFLRRTSIKDISQVKSEPQEGKDEPSSNGDIKRTFPREEGGMALTIYGNSSNPKQLFSSLKRPAKINLQPHDSDAVSSIEIQTPLNEKGLPNGISATKVLPHNGVDTKSKSSTRTIGDVFHPRPTLPQLEPVRKGKPTRKSSAVTWVDWFDVAADSKALPNERGSYNLSALPSGQWLHYGGGSTPNSNANRTQQENGDVRKSDDPEQRQLSDEKILFQSLYSSFAPSFDSSGAIIPEDAKDQMWWNKLGEKRFRTFLSLQYPEDELTEGAPEDNAAPQELDEETLEEAVNSYVPQNEPPEILTSKETNGDVEDKDMEEVLNEIGELLETLNSYNRIRNLAPPGSRSGNEANAGTPDTPSAAEVTVYETLKASLSAMIATLPPYAVAKLDGEQLSDLNISKKILVENVDYHGTMEVDDYTAQQRHASRIAATAATGRTATQNLGPGSRSSSYQSPATSSSYNQRPISSNPRPHQTPRGYPPQQPYGRQSQPNHFPSNIAAQTYQASRQSVSTPQRATHGTPKYPQSASSQYGSQGTTLQQFQRSSQNGVGRYSPQQGHMPVHNSPQQYQQRPSQQGYPQRAPEGAYNTPLAAGRSASPQKPPNYGTPQPHSPFMNSTPSAQQRYMHHPQQQPHHQMPQQPHQLHYNNFPSSRTPPMPNTVPNSAAIAASIPYQRSAAEQAALMDRNKTQLDINQQRQSSNTPQPPHSISPVPPHSQPRTESMQEMNYNPGAQQNGMTNMNSGPNH
ncbi:hypothetical protein FQN54_004877 [Arachnomyces sp. PD_36]|nr:hypothetical protein FQN54_004877 [Arachnomyces sp. PD_36]